MGTASPRCCVADWRGIIHGAVSIQHTIAKIRTAIFPEWRTMQPSPSGSGIDVRGWQHHSREGPQ